MPAYQIGHDWLGLPAADHERSEPLPVQGVLQVVPHPAVDCNVQPARSLDRDHAVQRQPGPGDHRAAWFDEQLDVLAEVLMRRANQSLGVLVHGWRGVFRYVADA
jgi:hypothetical protein